jgi:hypothetical protein
MSSSAAHLIECPNCGAALSGAYCASCGQKNAPVNPSMHDVLHEVTHEFLHLDGKLLRSMKLLALLPGTLTRELFAGRRASFVTPLRLYLVCSLMYFGTAAFAPGLDFRVTVGAAKSGGSSFSWRNERRSSDPEELRRYGFANQQELEAAVGEAVVLWVPRVMFILVPLFAAMLALVTRGSGHNYPQHVYFALHVHAAWFLALTVAALGRLLPWGGVQAAIGFATLVFIGVYFGRALRRAYGVSRAGGLWRTAAVGLVYGLAVAVALVGVVLPVVLMR